MAQGKVILIWTMASGTGTWKKVQNCIKGTCIFMMILLQNKEGIDDSRDDIDYIRQQFLKQDRETVKVLADKLAKVGLEKESKEFLSLKPMHKETIQKLDRFFEVLHSKHYNDLEIIDFYLSLSPEERVELGCKP